MEDDSSKAEAEGQMAAAATSVCLCVDLRFFFSFLALHHLIGLLPHLFEIIRCGAAGHNRNQLERQEHRHRATAFCRRARRVLIVNERESLFGGQCPQSY
jgi:hypothetical protein